MTTQLSVFPQVSSRNRIYTGNNKYHPPNTLKMLQISGLLPYQWYPKLLCNKAVELVSFWRNSFHEFPQVHRKHSRKAQQKRHDTKQLSLRITIAYYCM